MTFSNPRNFCGGNYSDWLEVKLTGECNGLCVWCVEHGGFNPKIPASYTCICKSILDSGAKNILLLGGEPTLYPDLQKIINFCASRSISTSTTTNGKLLSTNFVNANLSNINNVNISIHHYNFSVNAGITGVHLDDNLYQAISLLINNGVSVRLNCNLIPGYIDSVTEIGKYLEFAKSLGIKSVRFAELKLESGDFVDLHKIYGDQYGLNSDPYLLGCVNNCVIDGINVNFRQMCGLQNHNRCKPNNPKSSQQKRVLYNDGKIYPGWISQKLYDIGEVYGIWN